RAKPARCAPRSAQQVARSCRRLDDHHAADDPGTAQGVADAAPGTLDVAVGGAPEELVDDVDDHPHPGGAEGMTAGLEPAAGVDGEVAADPGPPLGGH